MNYIVNNTETPIEITEFVNNDNDNNKIKDIMGVDLNNDNNNYIIYQTKNAGPKDKYKKLLKETIIRTRTYSCRR